MENVLMWYFENLMGYRLWNPCKIVYVYHNHCVLLNLPIIQGIIITKAPLLLSLTDCFDFLMRRI